MEYSEETLRRAKNLFPTNYVLAEYIRNNDNRALDIVRSMDIEPYIHVNEILKYLNQEFHETDWGVFNLKHKAQRISDIVALEELMLDEMNILQM